MLPMIVIYLSFCCVIGLIGRTQPLGFAIYFILSIFITPLGGLVVMFFLMFHTRAANRMAQRKAQHQARFVRSNPTE